MLYLPCTSVVVVQFALDGSWSNTSNYHWQQHPGAFISHRLMSRRIGIVGFGLVCRNSHRIMVAMACGNSHPAFGRQERSKDTTRWIIIQTRAQTMLSVIGYLRRLSLAPLITLFLFTSACHDDSPTKPEPPPEQIVYMWDGGQENRYFEFKPASNELDSFDIEFDPYYGLSVSPDGRRLYGAGDDGVAVVDLTTRTLLEVLPYPAYDGVLASPDGSTLAIGSDSLLILSADDFSVLYHQSYYLGAASFSKDGRHLYSITSDSITIFTLDAAITAESRPNKLGFVGRLLISPDESAWYLYRYHGLYTFSFAVYDAILDSIVFVRGLSPGAGDLEVTPNDQYVFFTNSGSLIFGPPPQYTFARYNTETQEVIEYKLNGECTVAKEFYPMGYVAISHDGRWLVALTNPGGGLILTFDIFTNTMTSFTCNGWDKDLRWPTSGIVPR